MPELRQTCQQCKGMANLHAMQNKLETQRLFLEIVTKRDHAFILALVNSPGWIEFIGDRQVHTQKEAIEFITRIKSTKDLHYWVVRRKGDRVPLGIISFIKRDYLAHFDIGFAFLPQFAGNGYAYEAATALMHAMKLSPRHQTILATTNPSNEKSIALLSKLGFRFDKQMHVHSEASNIYVHDSPMN